MELKTSLIDDSLLVKIIGELDHHTSEDIRMEIDQKLRRGNVKNIIFDLSEMSFMDSSGVGMFMGRYKQVKAKNGLAIMICVQDSNRRLLKMSGLFNIYREYDNLDDALKAVRRERDEQ